MNIKSNMKKENIIIGGVILLSLILGIFVSYLFLIGTVLVSVGYILYAKYGNQKNTSESEPKESTIKDMSSDGVKMNWESEIATDEAYKYLLKVNYDLRVNGNYVSEEHVSAIELLIDDLRQLVLDMDDSTSVLKWKINQICVEFMPQLIGKFNNASNQTREQLMDDTIKDIQNKVTEIQSVIDTNRQEDFEHYAKTLQKIMAA